MTYTMTYTKNFVKDLSIERVGEHVSYEASMFAGIWQPLVKVKLDSCVLMVSGGPFLDFSSVDKIKFPSNQNIAILKEGTDLASRFKIYDLENPEARRFLMSEVLEPHLNKAFPRDFYLEVERRYENLSMEPSGLWYPVSYQERLFGNSIAAFLTVYYPKHEKFDEINVG